LVKKEMRFETRNLLSVMIHRYFIVLQYNGKNYQGWQIQPNGPTIQAEINEKLSILLKESVETTGAGRTDTGVHANFFVAHFDLTQNINDSLEKIIYKLNRFLPNDIRVIKILPVDNNAHARFDAISRSYYYYISAKKEVFKNDFVWQFFYKLDIDLMNQGSEILKEYRDFTSFSKLETEVKTNFCNIMSAEWKVQDDTLMFAITADRFLRNMVRAIVGTMVNLGRHKINLDQFRQIIEAKDRSQAGESVPAQGLFLWNIIYPYEL
jgi:tRNA pseudouridine38-40 synthase